MGKYGQHYLGSKNLKSVAAHSGVSKLTMIFKCCCAIDGEGFLGRRVPAEKHALSVNSYSSLPVLVLFIPVDILKSRCIVFSQALIAALLNGRCKS